MDSVWLQQNPDQILPVPTVYCVGLNYADHAAEMHSERPAEPVIFLKPASALSHDPQVHYPRFSTELHHEIELVVALADDLRNIQAEEALERIWGYGIGLDLTLRDRQARAKAKGQPWAVAKGFAESAPISAFVPASRIADPQALEFGLKVNGENRQQGATRQMLFSVAELVAYLSTVFQLRRGDLIFTGTPAGVGPLQPGDQLEAWLADHLELRCRIV